MGGWYADPARRFRYRYWSGDGWTDRVLAAGSRDEQVDPLEPQFAGVAPALHLPAVTPTESRGVPPMAPAPRKPIPWRMLVALLLVAAAVAGVVLLVGGSHDGSSAGRAKPPNLNVIVGTPSTTAIAGPPLVNEQDAKAVVAQMWPEREQALARDDVAATDRIESGVAREADDGASRDDRLLPPGTGIRRVRTYSAVQILLPEKPAYPTSFLAEVATTKYTNDCCKPSATGDPWVEMLVFTKQNSGAPWKISFVSGFDGGASLFLTPGLSIPSGDFYADTPANLATYWQYWADHGTAPANSSYAPGYWTTEHGAGLAAAAAGGVFRCDCAVSSRFTESLKDTIWSFEGRPPTTNGPLLLAVPLACYTVRHTTTVDARPNEMIVQDQTRQAWGGWLQPGLYRSLKYRSVDMMCAMQVGPGQIGVFAGGGGFTDLTGTPASSRSTKAQ
jgi:hypothetical protein